MSELKPYPEYKDSGVKWIGEIPEDWGIVKIKFCSRLINGYSFNSDEYVDVGIPVIRIGDIAENINWKNTKRIPDESISKFERFLIQENDILIAMTGATIGKTTVFRSKKEALLNQRVGIIRARKGINGDFLSYLIHSSVFKGPVKFLCYGGAQENIGTMDIGNILIPYPKKHIQEKIGVFLVEKVSQIDSLIDDKERLIKLLDEKRQAIITETVTKGLDPNVKMKDSGIEWIGEVPEHWNLGKVGYLFEITLGKMIQPSSKRKGDELVPYLKANNIQDGFITYEKVDEMYASPSEIKRYELEYNDLLVCEGGDVARSAFVEEYLDGYIFQNALHRVRGTEKGDVRYLHYLLNMVRNSGYIDLLVNRATIAHFTKDKFSSLKIPCPPINEQKNLITFIQKIEREIKGIIKDVYIQIKKLEEYRESLIYEAVTGKIDVRDYATEKEKPY
ncbi:MAG TPA: restriction endonuclease subunit S [Virgibacillus sp.]|nr:restriction endonuclease subunit S [Virgibacillus sp.]HLR69574.1 restriction endonuclease subunit S [Virgibacillus sp.]